MTENIKINNIVGWAGCKAKLMNLLFEKFPKDINTYYEPFMGGASVLNRLLSELEAGNISINKIKVNDVNKGVIALYKNIKNNLDNLIDKIDEYVDTFNQTEEIQYESRHKWVIEEDDTIDDIIPKGRLYLYYFYRNMYNFGDIDDTERAALFLILNKTCYKSIWSENQFGFATPYAHACISSRVFNENEFIHLNQLLNDYKVEFHSTDFMKFCDVKKMHTTDFLYLDPPYYPESKTYFTKYTADGFKEKHDDVVKLCNDLDKKGIKFLQSNSATDYVFEKYDNFNIEEVVRRGGINNYNDVYETLIYNYKY